MRLIVTTKYKHGWVELDEKRTITEASSLFISWVGKHLIEMVSFYNHLSPSSKYKLQLYKIGENQTWIPVSCQKE